MDKLYVLDASGYLYRSYFAIRNITNAKGESTNALFGFIRSVNKLFKDFSPQHLIVVFDGPHNIEKRQAIYSDYKAHREKTPEDLRYQIEWAKQFCQLMGLPILAIPQVEADDTMGSIAKWAEQKNTTVYLCTSDKDMCQLVNQNIFILNTHKDNQILGAGDVEAKYGVPPNKIIDWLAITGDTSDNVPGLPGFGPKTASALLQKLGSLDYILSHPEEVPGKKKQETIVQDAEKARISQQLVTIDTSVDFPKEADFFTCKPADASQLKDFYASMNFNSFIRELDDTTIKDEKVTYTLVDDEKDFQELLKTLRSAKEICFDTETTNVRPMQAELVGIGFAIDPKKAWYVPLNGNLGQERVLDGVKPLFESKENAFYGHNVKYDWHVMANYSIHIRKICFDTILASYILNSHSRQHSLDHLSMEYFGKVKIPISSLIGKGKQTITMREVPIDKVCTYCCEDVDYTCRLKNALEKELKDRKLNSLMFDLELPLMQVLVHMERHGIYVDVPYLEKMSKEIGTRIHQAEEEIYALVGEHFNINSPKQLSEILFDKMGITPPKKTATGYSTNAEVLESLKHDYPIAEKVIDYRTLAKLKSTYLDTLPHEVDPRTQRIHPTFNQSVAATGRLSCQDPNLQNIPIRTEIGRQIREAFRPEKEGWSFLSADYSQIELRLLAHLSEDPTLIHAFENHEDIHAHTASKIFDVPLDQVSKELRHHAKAVNFGIIYGQQAFGLARELGVAVKDADAFIKMYFERYGRVQEYLEKCKEQARKTGKAVTFTGRERAIPEINSKNKQIRAAAERLAVNTPFQGTAADLIKQAMLDIEQELKKKKMLSFMVLQIHDELIFELPDFEKIALETLVKNTMEGVIKLKVPLIVDIAIGKNWKEC